MQRCAWVNLGNPEYVHYHDEEWGVPVYDDRILFEFLVLEGAQAWLSWETVLSKRENYRSSFHSFDVRACSEMDDAYLESLLENPGIIRNRLKIWSVRKNARIFLQIQQEFGSFSDYLWGFTGGDVILNRPESIEEVPAQSLLSEKISKDLKQRGMSFVWPTIIYAYLQAVWVVNDHTRECFCAAGN